MIPLHRPGTSLVHRAPAGLKLVLLMTVAITVSVVQSTPWVVAAVAAVTVLLHLVAGLGFRGLAQQVLAARWLIVILAATQLLFLPLPTALLHTGRVVLILLLAALVTMTTSTAAMLDTVERALGPFRRFGVDPVRVGLLLAITIATIPVLQSFAATVREAQLARGVRVPAFRLVIPLLVMALKHADDLGDALASRGLGDATD